MVNSGKFEDKYILGEFLGKGAFGSVNECFLKTNTDVKRAVKLVSRAGKR